MSREFQIPMQPFVSSERDKKKKRSKSGKLVGGKGKRERERGRERKKRGFPKGGEGVQVLFIRIINARRRQVGSLGCLGIWYLIKPGKEESEE